jgi:hypothetical protein
VPSLPSVVKAFEPDREDKLGAEEVERKQAEGGGFPRKTGAECAHLIDYFAVMSSAAFLPKDRRSE